MAIKKVLSGFTVYVDGIDYVGVAQRFTPPPIELALEALAGNPRAVETPVLCVGVLTDGATPRRVEYELTGLWTKQEAPEVGGTGGGGGGRDGCTYTIGVRTLTHRIDGDEVRHVDLEANIHRINGTDVNAELRTALRRRP